jgi:hypothetical protein
VLPANPRPSANFAALCPLSRHAATRAAHFDSVPAFDMPALCGLRPALHSTPLHAPDTQAATARSFDIDSIGATTALRAREVVSAASHASAMGVASVVGTPPVSFFAVLALLLFAKAVEPYIALAASPTPRYAWVATKRGKCVGLIGERDGVPQAHFGGNDKLPNPMTLDTLPPRFAPSAIVGRTMRLANGKRGRVVGVTGAPVTNREQLVLDSGAHGDLPGACAEE